MNGLKKRELPYFNAGCCIHSKGITGIEIDGGEILLVTWRIRADKNGALYFERFVTRGPESIENYVFK